MVRWTDIMGLFFAIAIGGLIWCGLSIAHSHPDLNFGACGGRGSICFYSPGDLPQ